MVTGSVSDPDPHWIRIQRGRWIRIRNSDPAVLSKNGSKSGKNCHGLKSQIFSL